MNPKQFDLVNTYVGMSEHRAMTFLAAAAHEHVHPATMTHFRDHGLIDDEGVTERGQELLNMILLIQADKLKPLAPVISPKLLDKIDLMRAARLPAVREKGVRSLHIKILRLVARNPGVNYARLLEAFTYADLDWMLDNDFLTGQRDYKYTALYLTIPGRLVLERILEAQGIR